MVSVICALIAAASAIIVALVAAWSGKTVKRAERDAKKEEERAQQRAKEARLQLAMIAANSELTVGVALALKEGHTNGEVEAGLEAVKLANARYKQFLEEFAIDRISE